MKTLKRTQLDRARTVPVSILLLLAMLAAALAALVPQPAQAATCVRYHWIQSGDTTMYIAKTYGLKWKQIAVANKMVYPFVLKPGVRLCIPAANAPAEYPTAPNVKFTASINNDRLTLDISGLSAKTVFVVKVRRAELGVGGWYKLGKLPVPKDAAVTTRFALPKALEGTTYLSVCLKNSSTDELLCKTVIWR
jgi:hypothetical protein